jgi:signal transduction histidine kinase/streptogramin lyase
VRKLPNGTTVFYPGEAAITSGNSTMIADQLGRIWMTRGKHLLVLNPEPPSAFDGVEGTVTRDFAPNFVAEITAEKELTMPGPGQIVEISSTKVGSFVEKSFAKYLTETRDGTVWLTADDHLVEFAAGGVHIHSAEEGLPNGMARMAEDEAGNLWIGGQTKLARLDRTGLVTFGLPDGLRSPRVLSVFESARGEIFVAGGNYNIGQFDGGRFHSARPEVPIGSESLWTSRIAFRSSNGEWWIMTGQRLFRFAPVDRLEDLDGKAPVHSYGEAEGLVSDHIYQMFEDRTGGIWVSTRASGGLGIGVARLRHGEERFQPFTEADGLPKGHSFASVLDDGKGSLWMTFYEGGIARYDGQRFHFYGENAGMPTSYTSDIHLDTSGRLWISSAVQGLYRLDDPASETPAFVNITTADGLSSNNIRTITEDRLGRIYLGTVRGVDRLSPDSGQVKHYSVTDGLADDFVTDSLCDSQGDVWFATNNGLSLLHPRAEEEAQAPRIIIGSVKIAGSEQPISELGALSFDRGEVGSTENNLQINYFGLDFRAGTNLRFQYKLEPSAQEWSQPSDAVTVTFANLSPDTYRFMVRAINPEGAVSSQPAIMTVRILPPYWQRWWFILSLAVFVTIGLVGFYRYRLGNLRRVNAALTDAKIAEERLRLSREERLAELEEVRVRIATDLHDDIGARLTQIAVLSEVAQAQSGGARNGGPPESLRKITEVSNELVTTMSDIVWSINPAKDHLNDLKQRIRRFAADLLTAKGITFQFHSSDEGGNPVLNSTFRREFYLIFKEAVNNVVKHSGARNVDIKIGVDDGSLWMRVVDDGVGIGDSRGDDTQGGNGLISMRRRARQIGGELSIHGGKSGGTVVSLRVPIERLHSTLV